MALCDSCISTAKQLSRVIASWEESNQQPPEPDLESFESQPWKVPVALPKGSIQHASSAGVLPRSALQCPFCELIRRALVIEGVRLQILDYKVDYDDFPASDIIKNVALNALFAMPLYQSSPIYLSPIRGTSFWGNSPKEGYHLETIVVTLQPFQYNEDNRYHKPLEIRLDVFSDIESAAGISGGISTRNPLVNSYSPEAFQLLRRWLNGCVNEHNNCRLTFAGESLISEDSILPTRVVEINPQRNPPVRLIQTDGRISGCWVALSHCWGKPEYHPICTTKATLQDRLEEIPIEALPRTFLDALAITKCIGLRYLWIDSLCIIQDDEDDWKKEAKHMGLIYERAYLTIAASDAPDSRSGCLYQRKLPGDLETTVKLPFFTPTSTEMESVNLMHNAGYFSVNIDWTLLSITNPLWGPNICELSIRGWTLQETILPRRIVHYQKQIISWTCKTEAETESGYKLKWISVPKNWAEIVEEITRRQFTYDKDRLYALDGLAMEMEKSRPKDRYHFGLWAGDLPGHLLWSSSITHELGWNLALQHVPSWSWASRTGNIEVRLPIKSEKTKDLTIVSHVCQINEIKESGPLWITSQLMSLNEGFVIQKPNEDELSSYPDVRDVIKRQDEETLLTTSGVKTGWVHFDEGHYCDKPYLQNLTFFLPVLRRRANSGRLDGYQGLLLQFSRSSKNSFKRVGVGAINNIELFNGVAEQMVCIV